MLECSGLDKDSSNQTAQVLEERKRLYWSLFHLNQLCGSLPKFPLLQDVDNPVYCALPLNVQKSNIKCLGLPYEADYEMGTPGLGIWAHLVRLSTVWTDVRDYVSCCANGNIKAPWLPDSQYNTINSRILDFETKFLDYYRYPKAKFAERTQEEISSKRQYWLPWMSTQMTYHTLHAVLNHPFLRAVTQSVSRFGQNVFWRASSDLALLHGNWLARMITMFSEQKLEASDPFLAHSAAVAASLHIYYCQAVDESVRSTAEANLEVCRSFVRKLAAHWPVCYYLVGH